MGTIVTTDSMHNTGQNGFHSRAAPQNTGTIRQAVILKQLS